MSYKITEEGKNRVKMNSSFSLPTSPSERGMKAAAIKEMFWKPFAELIELINASIGGLEYEDETIKSSIDSKISTAMQEIEKKNQGKYATKDDLHQIDIDFNSDLSNGLSHLYDELSQNIIVAVEGHSADKESHEYIRNLAQVAYDAAVGKRTVWYETTMQRALEAVALNSSIAQGNVMIIGVKGVPDLIIFPNEDDALKNASIITIEEIRNEAFPKITAGSFFKISGGSNDFGFAAIESGIDTSAFATTKYVDGLVGNVNALLDSVHEYAQGLKGGESQ